MKCIPQRLEQWYSKAKNVEIDISSSGINVYSLIEILKKCNKDLNYLTDIYLDYDNSQGEKSLREEIAQIHSTKSNSVLITNGASEALFLSIMTLMNKQQNLIIETPFYQDFKSYSQFVDGTIRKWKISESDHYHPDIDKLNRLIDVNTKAVLINHPHNPTGSSIDLTLMKEILTIAEEHNFFVISDEVSRELTVDKKYQLPPIASISNNGISIASVSKAYGLPGIRVGWVVGNQKFIKKCRLLQEQITICSSPISQSLALLVLQNRKKLLNENNKIIKSNIRIADDWITKNSSWCRWIKPTGGACGFPQYYQNIPSNTLCKSILNDSGVLLVPGSIFGCEKHFRLGMGGNSIILKKGLQKIEKFMNSQKDRNAQF